jgi:Homeodomain-like domain
MRGRRPRPLEIAPHDVPILQQIARSRSLPWYQVQRAQILLAVAAGEPIRSLAIRTQCNPSTVWRICRRYEDAGLPDLLEPAQRAGRPARISPPATRPDRSTGLLGAGRQGVAHHPLDEPGSGPPSCRRWDRLGHQRSDGPSDPQSSGPPAASHSVLADVSHRRPVQGARREDPLVLCQRRAVGPAGLLGGLCR